MGCRAGGDSDICRLLIGAGADSERRNLEGNTPLLQALANCHLIAAAELIRNAYRSDDTNTAEV